MKKLIIVLIIVLSGQLYAQIAVPLIPPPDMSLYDTMIVYNPFLFDSAIYVRYDDLPYTYSDTIEELEYIHLGHVIHPVGNCNFHYQKLYTGNFYESERQFLCGTNPYNDFHTYHEVIGSSSFSAGLAQPWHLDSNALICGLAAWMTGNSNLFDTSLYYYIMDTNFRTLTREHLRRYDGDQYTSHWDDERNCWVNDTFYVYKEFENFYFSKPASAKDFYLGVDIAGQVARFNYTCSITDSCMGPQLKALGLPYDTIFFGLYPPVVVSPYREFLGFDVMGGTYKPTGFMTASSYPPGLDWNFFIRDYDWPRVEDIDIVDTLVLWQSPYPPAFKNHDGQWRTFDQDSIFDLFQRTFIEILPIILVPHNTTDTNNNLTDVYLENNTWAYPNPAHDILNIVCGFKINTIEIYDLNGKLIKTIDAKQETKLNFNVKSLEKGVYILKLNTQRGIVNKKIIKQ